METNIPYNLIVISFSGELPSEERKQLDAWLNENEQNKALFAKLEKVWKESGRLSTEFSPDAYSALNKVHERIGAKALSKPARSIPMFGKLLLAAAGIALLVGITYFLMPSGEETMLVSETQKNQNIEIKIADGSVITLNKNSKLTYPETFKEKNRKVILEGEAYFEVAKDSTKPFVIEANGTKTTVLGTHFNLKAYSTNDSTILSLTEGKVRFEAGNHQVILAPGEKALFVKSKSILQKIQVTDVNYMSWKTKVLQFNNTSLIEVSNTLSQYFDKQIVINDSSLANLGFTGKFNNPKLSVMLNTLEEALDIKATEQNNKIILSK